MSKPFHGLTPIKYRVIVEPDKAESVSAGGIIIPENKQDRDQHAIMEGVIVAVSPMAFTWDEWPSNDRKPEEGDRVVFARYSGSIIKGNDGEEYRVMNDDDIMAVRNIYASSSERAA